MGTRARFGVMLMALFVGGIAAAVGLWFVSSGDTTTVLAAFTEQTPTPGAQAVSSPTPVSNKKQKKADAGHVRGAFGSVSALSGTTLTVLDPQGTASTYRVDATTRRIVVGKANAAATDLTVGDKVLVLGVSDASGLTARVVISAPATYDVKNVLAGRIAGATATQVQIETHDTVKQVNLGTGAQVLGADLAPVQAETLKTKAPVLVFGEPATGDAFTGQVLIVLPSGKDLQAQRKMTKAADKLQRKADKAAAQAQKKATKKPKNKAPKLDKAVRKMLPGLAAFGTVSAVNGNTLTLQPQLAARDVTLDASTKIIVVGKPNATASDLQVGDKLLVVGGGQNKKKAPNAVLAAPASYTLDNVVLGQIMSVNGTTLALGTRNGDLGVTVGSTAQIYGDGLQTLAVSDLTVDRAVIVFGTRGANGTMAAQVVFMPPGKK